MPLQVVTGGLLYLFSRKERAKRKQAQQAEQPPVPPAYRANYHEAPNGPRSAHPRPLSTFAPDYSHYHYAPRASMDQPPLPTYDPSKYQPIRPTSTNSADLLSSYGYANPRGQPSRLSEVHYNDARSSIYQPAPPQSLPAHARRQSTLPLPLYPTASAERSSRSGDGRERSYSEPRLSASQAARGPKRAKPVLSRLITNF
ncbi:hypothetical protein N7523_010834 [Penicillium sp. IBT 18751x]|nr:hypothetical protein N7523_010834 [Penicillium sp. IBT 18751x]